MRPLCLLLLGLVLAAGPARPGEDDLPRAFEAWEARVPGHGEAATLELPLPRGAGPFDGRGELVQKERWAGVVTAWAGVAEDETDLTGLLVRPRSGGAAWIQARALARQLLAGLPAAGREPLRIRIEAYAQALMAAPAEQREAGWRQLLARYPGSDAAPLAARLLGEAHLERGELDAALFVWRLGGADGEPGLRARSQALRARMRSRRSGSLGAPTPTPRGEWRVLWARAAAGGAPWQPRAVVADGARLYLADTSGVLAVDREEGLLAWRLPLRGDPSVERLALARGTLLLLRPERLVAIRADDGEAVWERRAPEGSRFVDVVATPAGFSVLLTLEGNRCLQGWTDQGVKAFELKLWRDPGRFALPSWLALRADWNTPVEPCAEHKNCSGHRNWLPPTVGSPRRIVDDGRLVALGDRVFATVDGVVFAASSVLGELVWLQDAAPGRAVAGRATLVQIAAGPFAVEAVTGLGHLVRLDPLDGTPLQLPAPPPEASADPWVLALDPPVLLHRVGEGHLLTCGVPGEPLLRLAVGPPAPGVIHGEQLCLPDPEGIVRLDLSAGDELGVTPWPLGPGPIQSVGGLLIVGGPRGIAVLAPEAPASPAPPPELRQATPEQWIEALDAADWRTRLLAQELLLALDELAPLTALQSAVQRARTLDARDRARDLLERLRLRRLLRELAPNAKPAVFQDIAQGVRVSERLRELKGFVRQSDKGSTALSEQVLELQDPAVRYALFELLMRVDAKLRDKLVAVVTEANTAPALRQAVAGALVDLAAPPNGIEGPARRAYQDPHGVGSEAILTAIMARGDNELLSRILGSDSIDIDVEPSEPDPRAHDVLLEALPSLLPRR